MSIVVPPGSTSTDPGDRDDLLTGERRILERIATGTPLTRVLEELVLLIESGTAAMLGSVLLLDQDRARLRHGAAPSLLDAYNARVDGLAIGPAVGSCGTARRA